MKRIIYITLFFVTSHCYGQQIDWKVKWGVTKTNVVELRLGTKSYIFNEKSGTDSTKLYDDSSDIQSLIAINHLPYWNPIDSSYKKIDIIGNYPAVPDWGTLEGYQIKVITYPKSITAYILDTINADSLNKFCDEFYYTLKKEYNGKDISFNNIKFITVVSENYVHEYIFDSLLTNFRNVLNRLQTPFYLIMIINGDVRNPKDDIRDIFLHDPDNDITVAWYIK